MKKRAVAVRIDRDIYIRRLRRAEIQKDFFFHTEQFPAILSGYHPDFKKIPALFQQLRTDFFHGGRTVCIPKAIRYRRRCFSLFLLLFCLRIPVRFLFFQFQFPFQDGLSRSSGQPVSCNGSRFFMYDPYLRRSHIPAVLSVRFRTLYL